MIRDTLRSGARMTKVSLGNDAKKVLNLVGDLFIIELLKKSKLCANHVGRTNVTKEDWNLALRFGVNKKKIFDKLLN